MTRDAEVHPPTADAVRLQILPVLDALQATVAKGCGDPPPATLRAAIGLATDFHTWDLLVRRHGLAHEQAIDLLSGMVASARSARV